MLATWTAAKRHQIKAEVITLLTAAVVYHHWNAVKMFQHLFI
jgi:hypothetical protein